MSIDEPRRAAYDLLYEVGVEDAYANLVMPLILAHYELSGRDASFATELGFGVHPELRLFLARRSLERSAYRPEESYRRPLISLDRFHHRS